MQSVEEKEKNTHPPHPKTNKQKNPTNDSNKNPSSVCTQNFFSPENYSLMLFQSSADKIHFTEFILQRGNTSSVQKLLSSTSESVVCRSIGSLLVFQDCSHSLCSIQKFQNLCNWNFACTVYRSRNLLYSLHGVVICYQLSGTGLALKWMRQKIGNFMIKPLTSMNSQMTVSSACDLSNEDFQERWCWVSLWSRYWKSNN